MGFLIACTAVLLIGIIFGLVLYIVASKNPEYAKVRVTTLQDDVATIRFIKELEYWKDIKNGK
jgi:hypothetical protein